MGKKNLRAKLTMAPGSETAYITIVGDVCTIYMRGELPFDDGLEFLKEWRKLKTDDEIDNKVRKIAEKYGLSAPRR